MRYTPGRARLDGPGQAKTPAMIYLGKAWLCQYGDRSAGQTGAVRGFADVPDGEGGSDFQGAVPDLDSAGHLGGAGGRGIRRVPGPWLFRLGKAGIVCRQQPAKREA